MFSLLNQCTGHRTTFECSDVSMFHFPLFETSLLVMSTVFADVSLPVCE